MKFARSGDAAAVATALCGQQGLAADAPPPKMDAKIHDQSMKDAPALVQQSGVDCTMSDAYLLGANDVKVGGKTVKTSFYEVACGSALGHIIKNVPGAPPEAIADCLALRNGAEKAIAAGGKAGATCSMLPGNADPKQGLAPYLAKANAPCPAITNAVWNGSSPTDKINVYEVACSDGVGYSLEVPMSGSTKPLLAIDCSKGVDCTLTSKEQIAARIIKLSAGAATLSKKPLCEPAQARWVGASATSGSDFYEIGCKTGTDGYMFELAKTGAFKAVIPCAQATRLGNGCSFTNVASGQTAELGTYQKLAQQIKDPCTVTKYQSYGAEDGGQREVVELACSDAPTGGYAVVPTGAGQSGEYFNCVRAEGRGYSCHLTPKEATYSKIAGEIAARGKTTCTVNGGRAIGKDDKGNDYIEVSCSGAPGLVLTYSKLPEETLTSALPCAQAPIANACKLGK